MVLRRTPCPCRNGDPDEQFFLTPIRIEPSSAGIVVRNAEDNEQIFEDENETDQDEVEDENEVESEDEPHPRLTEWDFICSFIVVFILQHVRPRGANTFLEGCAF